ncbi:Uncharacterised protein [Edwardsiella tarda]|nr:Uncharacterised protein [Edwardsiella tarda]
MPFWSVLGHRRSLVGVIAWQAYENSQQRGHRCRNTTIGTLNEQNRTLRQQRDQAQAAMALQALQFNRANQISEEARRVRQQSGIRAEQVRRDVHTGISAHTCTVSCCLLLMLTGCSTTSPSCVTTPYTRIPAELIAPTLPSLPPGD